MRVIKKRGEKTGEDLLRYSIQRATSRFTIFKWWRGKSEKNYSLIHFAMKVLYPYTR